MVADHLNVLRGSPFFLGISDEDIIEMMQCFKATEHVYSRGEIIMRTDEKTNGMAYFIVEGHVDTIEEDFWGNETLLGRFGPGQVVGDAFMLTGRDKFPFHVVSHRRSVILHVDFKGILEPCQKRCDRHLKLVQNLLPVFAEKVVYLLDLVSFITKRSLRSKLLSYLSSQAKKAGSNSFEIDLDRQRLANYLAVDRSSLSAELSKMQQEGLISYQKNNFVLHDM